MNPYLQPQPLPRQLNLGLSALREVTCLRFLGPPDRPAANHTQVTRSVGPFRVTGHARAVASLARVLAEVRARHPDLHALLGTAGMRCVRRQRGNASRWSNHAWGLAIDLTLAGLLDRRGDGKVQAGLLLLAPIFNRHGWFWGAAFGVEDAMHFEVAEETVRRWHSAPR